MFFFCYKYYIENQKISQIKKYTYKDVSTFPRNKHHAENYALISKTLKIMQYLKENGIVQNRFFYNWCFVALF